jgi:hypothetical protein
VKDSKGNPVDLATNADVKSEIRNLASIFNHFECPKKPFQDLLCNTMAEIRLRRNAFYSSFPQKPQMCGVKKT